MKFQETEFTDALKEIYSQFHTEENIAVFMPSRHGKTTLALEYLNTSKSKSSAKILYVVASPSQAQLLKAKIKDKSITFIGPYDFAASGSSYTHIIIDDIAISATENEHEKLLNWYLNEVRSRLVKGGRIFLIASPPCRQRYLYKYRSMR